MDNIHIKKSALEEFLAELVGHGAVDTPIAVYEPSISSKPLVAINAEIDDENIIVEPPVGDPDFVPINKVELAKSLYTISKSVPPDDIGKFYKDVKELFLSLKDTGTIMNIETNEALLRKKIRKLIREAWDDDEGGYSIIDPADQDIEEEEEYDRQRAQQAARREKEVYKDIAKATGLSTSGARGEEVRAVKRYIFLMNLADVAQDDYATLIASATDDYITYLSRSGGLSDKEVKDLNQSPDLVQELEGFRDHMRKHVTRVAKEKGIDLGWEKDFDDDARAAFGAHVRTVLGV